MKVGFEISSSVLEVFVVVSFAFTDTLKSIPAREDFKLDDRVSMDNFIIKCDLVSGIFFLNCFSDFGTMPSDIVSIAVSAGFGVSVLAGILSGVCYILTQKVQKPKR